ncbi:sensor histidine kinase [Yinghuangia soli]|uniref:histidine kinase n=1 Tax=Yinghuangia soli TaxID=2908204 RepID=A0AA41TYT7_9ACTN|nr:histidine kinase [Yinghuangia soli]MCF2528133.1 histidine kinase [Yinghuangia soli]
MSEITPAETTAAETATRARAREYAATAAALALGITVLAVGRAGGQDAYTTVPAALAGAVALGVLGCLPRSRRLLAAALTGTALVSLAADLFRPRPAMESTGGWKITEVGVLMLLIAVTTRWGSRRQVAVAAVPAVAAVALWVVPFLGTEPRMAQAGAVLFWAAGGAIAAAAGAYPRRQARRARRAVAEARRTQQLELAKDLHDFVAHDVSAIVVQAQAARFVAAQDPQAAILALERIEKAGLSALASMDRTVQMLFTADGAPIGASAPPGVGELPGLVGRYAGERDAPVRLDIDPDAAAALSREAGAAAYRVVVEALTNVRRHARPGARIEVAVRQQSDADRAGRAPGIEVAVRNDAADDGESDGPAKRPAGPGRLLRRNSGRGLAGLDERVAAAGGRLTAGPASDGGWQVAAVFPGQGRATGRGSRPA